MKRLLTLILCTFFLALSCFTMANDIVLGPSDMVKISVFGHTDLALEARISTSGNITFPLIGEVQIGGLSPSNAEKKIATQLEGKGYIKNPQVNLIVTVMQSQQVSILGQVGKPGRYPLDGIKNVTDLLALAGGIGPEGGDIITLLRDENGKTQKTKIDLSRLISSNSMDQNIELKANDIVFVEVAPKFYVYGEVQKPGAYKLEKNMTILQAISTGGGLTSRGTEKGILIKRKNSEGALESYKVTYDTQIQQDDIIYVKESLF